MGLSAGTPHQKVAVIGNLHKMYYTWSNVLLVGFLSVLNRLIFRFFACHSLLFSSVSIVSEFLTLCFLRQDILFALSKTTINNPHENENKTITHLAILDFWARWFRIRPNR
jgi:hypothetical protein